MTALAEVFAEIRPDTKSFAGELKKKLAGSKEVVEVGAKLDKGQFDRAMTVLKKDLKSVTSTKAKIEADSAGASAMVKALKLDLATLNTQVKIDGESSELTAKIEAAKAQLASVSGVKAKLNVDSALATTKLKIIKSQINDIDGQDPTVKVHVDGDSMAGATRGVGLLTTAMLAVGPAAIPVLAATTAAVGVLGAAMGAAAGAGGIFGASVAGVVHGMTEGQEEIKKLTDRLATQEKGSEEYRDTLHALNVEQKQFNEMFGPAAKGLDAVSRGWQKFMDATRPQTTKIMGAAMQTLADVLPRLAPASNAAARAVGYLVKQFDGWTKGPGFAALLDFFEKRGPGMIKTFGRSVGNVFRGLGSLFAAFIPSMGGMTRGFEGLTKSFDDWAAGLSKTQGFKNFIEYVRENGPRVIALIGGTFGALVTIVKAFAPFGAVMLGLITKIAGAISRMDPTTIRVMAGLFAAWVITTRLATTALLAHAAAMRVVKVATVAWAGATKVMVVVQRALNLAMRANPIGIVITALTLLGAGLVLAYKKSDTFRKIVDKAWSVIKKSITAAWDKIKGALEAMAKFFTKTLPDAAKKMYTDLKKQTAAGWRDLKARFSDALKMIKDNVSDAVKAFVKFWKDLFASLRERTTTGWRLLRASFSAAFAAIREALRGWVSDAVGKWKGLFADLKSIASRAWAAVQVMFGIVFARLKGAFSTAVSAIGRIWDGLKEAARKPVEFVVNTVYNQGIRKVVNAIPGVDPLPEVQFATGGYTGPGPKMKAAGIVHAGEHVWTQEEMRHFPGGHDRMEQLRKRFRGGVPTAPGKGDVRGLPGYWIGGGVLPAPLATSGTSSPSHGTSYYGSWWASDMNRGSGNTDMGDPVVAWKSGRVAFVKNRGNTSYGRYMDINHSSGSSRYAHLSGTSVSPGESVRMGQRIGSVGNTGWPGMTAHLHFEARGGSSGASSGTPVSAVYGTGGTGTRNISIPNPLSALDLSGWKDRLGGMGDWGKMMGQMAGNVVPAFTGWAKDKISDLYGKVTGWLGDKLSIPGGDSGSSGSGSGSMNANNLVPIMQQAMNFAKNKWGPQGLNNIYGYSDRYIAGTNTKSDHAYGKALDFMTYSNMGLGDEIARYFRGAGEGRFNVDNVIWRAPDHYDHVHIDTFDRGGLARGIGRLPKNDIRPERVLSNRQTVAFEEWMAGNKGGGNVPTVHVENLYTRDDQAAARALAREQVKAYALARLA